MEHDLPTASPVLLIGKAIFRGEDTFGLHPMNRGRVITWSLMLGAIFSGFRCIPRYFLQRSAPGDHLASQHHALAGAASALGRCFSRPSRARS